MNHDQKHDHTTENQTPVVRVDEGVYQIPRGAVLHYRGVPVRLMRAVNVTTATALENVEDPSCGCPPCELDRP